MTGHDLALVFAVADFERCDSGLFTCFVPRG